MHKVNGWSGLRIAVLALGLAGWFATDAQASPLFKYSTAGAIDSTGITGAGNVISYVPVTNKTIDPSSNIPLGTFQVAALQDGQSTTYTNTPFTITLLPGTYDGVALGDVTPLVITGHLNGTAVGGYQSTVTATFDPIADGVLTLGTSSSTLSISSQSNQKLLVPADSTTVEGSLSALQPPPLSTPEPSTVALFLTTVGGLSLRRFVHARRRPAKA